MTMSRRRLYYGEGHSDDYAIAPCAFHPDPSFGASAATCRVFGQHLAEYDDGTVSRMVLRLPWAGK